MAIKKTKKKTRRKYGRKASAKVEKAMGERKRGTLRSGCSEKKVTSRKQSHSDRARSGPSGGGKGTAKGIVGT